MGKTLYLSDVDGTLAGADGGITPYTREVIRELIARGGLFSVATGRSLQMANSVIQALDLQLPVLLNNGVSVYDPLRRRYCNVSAIPSRTVGELDRMFRQHRACGFMYALDGTTIKLFYHGMYRKEDHLYHDERFTIYEGHVYQVDDLEKQADQGLQVMNFVVYTTVEQMSDLFKDLVEMKEVVCIPTRDVYARQYYFMDIFSSSASKGIGMQLLKEITGADRVVAFGDNSNDISMLLEADEAYAPENAEPDVKDIADGIIGHHGEDGVARFLWERMQRSGDL